MNIKMLKLYGWEEKFSEQITSDFKKEQKLQETQRIPNAIEQFVAALMN